MLNLKTLREAKGLTQQQLANEIHCARTVIANIETGNSSPSIATAKALGEVFGVNWWEFFEEGEDVNGADSVHGIRSS